LGQSWGEAGGPGVSSVTAGGGGFIWSSLGYVSLSQIGGLCFDQPSGEENSWDGLQSLVCQRVLGGCLGNFYFPSLGHVLI